MIEFPEAVPHPEGILVKLPPGTKVRFFSDSTNRAAILLAVDKNEDMGSAGWSLTTELAKWLAHGMNATPIVYAEDPYACKPTRWKEPA